jgi:hypothetical protein
MKIGAAGTEDKDRQVSNADGMTNFSAGSGSKPKPYIIGKGKNNERYLKKDCATEDCP